MAEIDLQTAARALASQLRGEHPTLDELLSYHDRELAPADRRRVRAHLAVCPECARAVLDMDDFPNVEAVDSRRALSDEDVAAGWEEFRELLRHEDPPAVVPVAPSRPPVWRSPWRVAGVATAVLLLAAGVAWLAKLGRGVDPSPGLNYQLAELAPRDADGERGEADTVRLPAEAGGVVLSLVLADPREFPAHAVTFRSLAGDEVWSDKRLKRDAGGFVLTLPRDFLHAGTYTIEVRGLEGAAETPLATYLLELEY